MTDYMKEAERLIEDFGHCRVAESILIRCGTPREVSCAKEKVESARAALLAHIQRGAVPDGWQVVPKEPTPEMISYTKSVEHCGSREPHTSNIYRAMLAAAPAPDHCRDAAEMAPAPSAFLARGARYKISNGTVRGLPRDLDGRWVALVAADDDCHLAPAPAEVPMPETVGWYVSGADPEHAALWRECPDDEQMQVMNQQCDDGPVVARPLVLGADAKRYGAACRDAGEAAGYARGLKEGVTRTGLSPAEHDVLAERQRQISAEGWTPEHDDGYGTEELAFAAACYCTADEDEAPPSVWPWHISWWKPTTRRRNLVKAGALILAEIERLDRAALRGEVKP